MKTIKEMIASEYGKQWRMNNPDYQKIHAKRLRKQRLIRFMNRKRGSVFADIPDGKKFESQRNWRAIGIICDRAGITFRELGMVIMYLQSKNKVHAKGV